MKLLARTNRYYIFYSVITYVIIAGAFYIVMDYVIRQDVEERLRVEKNDFENYISNNGKWNQGNYFVENKIELKPSMDSLGAEPVFKDTILFNRYSGKYVPFREINFNTRIKGSGYKVSIRKSLIESNDLLYFITAIMLTLLLLGLLLLFMFQRKISKQIWMPFYFTLAEAKAFDVKINQELKTESGDIYEFNELSEVLSKMTQKMRKDYQNLKEFTENASHEIQTPLALINARIEQLIQHRDFTEEEMYWIQEIHNSSMRLSKLNHALLLLSKIENEQFPNSILLDFNQLIQHKLLEYEDVLNHKNVELQYKETDVFMFLMNRDLADILVSNILGNAFKHNMMHGMIKVSIYKHELIIENTGMPLKIESERLFERFKKDQVDSNSLGLGLAIVKKICDYYHLDISYMFENHMHKVKISAKP